MSRSKGDLSNYDRLHAVRLCRDKCAEEGYSSRAFLECVEECVKNLTK